MFNFGYKFLISIPSTLSYVSSPIIHTSVAFLAHCLLTTVKRQLSLNYSLTYETHKGIMPWDSSGSQTKIHIYRTLVINFVPEFFSASSQ